MKISLHKHWVKQGFDVQVIRIASRLWNATLVEDYAYGVNYVVIKSNAEIRLDPTLNIKQDRHNDFFAVRHVLYWLMSDSFEATSVG